MKRLSLQFYMCAFLFIFSCLHGNDKPDSYAEVEDTEYTFAQLAGVDEVVEDLQDFVHFLKDPDDFTRLGARVPKGALLVGPPGTGKTSLARALAGEVGCEILLANGAEFDQNYVGVGAARIRELFDQARACAPCILFIDEIDAVGMKRTSDDARGGRETLNQLLSEMDGFVQPEAPVIILGATNRPDILDLALTRPGRFDRTIEVPNPTVHGRFGILKLHAKNKKICDDVDLELLARGMPGSSGADLENLLNEAAIIATRKKRGEITSADIEEARDKILLGKAIKSIVLTDDEKRITAYHEAGHTLVRVLSDGEDDSFHKVTIVPRGRTLGVTHAIPTREKYTQSEQEMRHIIRVALGGKAAEDLVFDKQFTGASGDLRKATSIARAMVCEYGMSEALGLMVYDRRVHAGPATKQVQDEIQKMLQEEYQATKKFLEANRAQLDALAGELFNQETLSAQQVYQLLGIQRSSDVNASQ